MSSKHSSDDSNRSKSPFRDLPRGALTLLQIGAHGEYHAAWLTVMQHLIASALDNGAPAAHVTCGPWADESTGRELTEMIRRPEFLATEDDDFLVQLPVQRGPADSFPEASYYCGVPTVDHLYLLTSAHEERYGPALLIVDRIDQARPYHYFAERLDKIDRIFALPSGIDLSSDAIHHWRAREFQSFAASRGHAPTVVVSTGLAPLDEMRAVASCLLLATDAQNGHIDVECIRPGSSPEAPFEVVAEASYPYATPGEQRSVD